MSFYHYSKNIDKIKKKRYIADQSFSKTNTYDMLLESCPELVLDSKEIAKLKKAKISKTKTYESKYGKLKLNFKNPLLTKFFSHNKYALAFDDEIPKGWVKYGLFQLLSNRIGNQYLKFEVTKEIAKKSFVLEQKYWSPIYSLKEFGVNSWNRDFKIEEHPKILKETFGKYYLSIKRLSDYKKGEFEVPEFWIYGKIPVKDCIISEISIDQHNKFIKEAHKIKGLKYYK